MNHWRHEKKLIVVICTIASVCYGVAASESCTTDPSNVLIGSSTVCAITYLGYVEGFHLGVSRERDRNYFLGQSVAGFSIVDAALTDLVAIASLTNAFTYRSEVTLSYSNGKGRVVLPSAGLWGLDTASGELLRGGPSSRDTNCVRLEYEGPTKMFWFIVNGHPYGLPAEHSLTANPEILAKEGFALCRQKLQTTDPERRIAVSIDGYPIMLTNGITRVYDPKKLADGNPVSTPHLTKGSW